MAPFKRLVRFKSTTGEIHFGETDVQDPSKESLEGSSAEIYSDVDPWDKDFKLTGEKAEIAEVYRSSRGQ